MADGHNADSATHINDVVAINVDHDGTLCAVDVDGVGGGYATRYDCLATRVQCKRLGARDFGNNVTFLG